MMISLSLKYLPEVYSLTILRRSPFHLLYRLIHKITNHRFEIPCFSPLAPQHQIQTLWLQLFSMHCTKVWLPCPAIL